MLSGIRILDLGDEKTSFCSRILADLGACVIKVEKPGGDASRFIPPFVGGKPHPDLGLSFIHDNINKLSVTCDLMQDKGWELFNRLLADSDVVIEPFDAKHSPGKDLDFKKLVKINPALVMVSVSGFGSKGPKSNFQSCDLTAAACGGQMYITGSPRGRPLVYPGSHAYVTASLHAALGILMGIRRARLDGCGTRIDISLQESVAAMLEHVFPHYFSENKIAMRKGGTVLDNGFCILQCCDGFVQLSIQQQWQTLVEWMSGDGMGDELMDSAWDDFDYRMRQIDQLLGIIGKWTRSQRVVDLVETAQLMRLPWAPVASLADVLKSPQLKERGFFLDVRICDRTSVKVPGLPFRFNSKYIERPNRIPSVGEHNSQIYGKELGYSKEELQHFLAVKAI